MADENYVRLRPACACGAQIPVAMGRGRPRKSCVGCTPLKPGAAPYVKIDRQADERACRGCGARFVCAAKSLRRFCGDSCRVSARNAQIAIQDRRRCVTCRTEFATYRRNLTRRWCSDDCKPKALRGLFSCLNCGAEFKRLRPFGEDAKKFCSRRCSAASKWKRLRENRPPAPAPRSKWFTGICRCGTSWGARRPREGCDGCERERRMAAAREASRAISEARHRATARIVACKHCGIAFCPIYGARTMACCSETCQRRMEKRERGGNHAQRAKRFGVPRKHFNEVRVLERDAWTCQICGVKTPKRLRGTTDTRAPELDHIVPLSDRSGPGHVPENCQCACRACNGAKGAKAFGQLWLTT